MHVVPGGEQQRDDHGRLARLERAEGCRDVGLLHVDVPEAHGRSVGRRRRDGVAQARAPPPGPLGRGAVRDRDEGGARTVMPSC